MDLLTGYAVFHWIATWANPPCDLLFRAATDLGYHTFYYLAIAPLFWAVDRRRASVLFLLILASGLLNTFAKLWVHTPRPDPGLARVLDFRPYQSGSNAFPSGHAQNAVVFWGYLAWWVNRRWFSWLAVSLIGVISFSRLYLGVHFPIDIVGGLLLGVLLMTALPRWLDRWAARDFHIGSRGFAAVTTASLLLTSLSADVTVAVICGSLIGFLIGTVYLPQPSLLFSNSRQSSIGVAGGLVVLLVLSGVFDTLPHQLFLLYAEVAVLWIVALWLYPQALHRLWLAPRSVDLGMG